jgi:DNA polymerase
LAAHNATGFDRFAIARAFGYDPGVEWIDTSELARRAGLPGSLDELGTRLLGLPKDKEGSAFTKRFSRLARPGNVDAKVWRGLDPERRTELGELPTPGLTDLDRISHYCRSDVSIMTGAWDYLDQFSDVEPDVLAVHRTINDRGVGFDAELAHALLEADEVRCELALRKAASALQAATEEVRRMASSPKQFCAAVGTPDARKQTVAGLDHPLAKARQALASIARGKLEAGLTRVSPDGRLRDAHVYYGAHTGRWSQRGMQLHNLPRPTKRLEKLTPEEIDAMAQRVIAGEYLPEQDEINMLLRATLTEADDYYCYSIVDFSGVEARDLAFRAGDTEAVNVFVRGDDVYRIMAALIFSKPLESIGKDGLERTVGKIAELACGYGMGAGKFEQTAANFGVNLQAAGINPQTVVTAWRRKHAPIVSLWRAVEDAFRDAMRGYPSELTGFEFCPAGNDVIILTPAGRPIVYRSPRIASDGRGLMVEGIHGEEHTYGGKIVENIIQADCRDLLATALVRLEDAGLEPVLHVHDESVCRIRAAQKDLAHAEHMRIMMELPTWATGFPIAAHGATNRRYCK